MKSLYYYILETPLGEMLGIVSDEGVHVLEFYTSEKAIRYRESLSDVLKLGSAEHPVYNRLRVELKMWFDGELREFSIRLEPAGTPFQKCVWGKLQQIPYGKTVSYEVLADQLGDRNSIRAAASANGANPIAILIPCHRVIGKDGSLTGYAGGLRRKRQLLDLERRVLGDEAYKKGDQLELL